MVCGLWFRQTWVQVPALQLTGCVLRHVTYPLWSRVVFWRTELTLLPCRFIVRAKGKEMAGPTTSRVGTGLHVAIQYARDGCYTPYSLHHYASALVTFYLECPSPAISPGKILLIILALVHTSPFPGSLPGFLYS